ncbi:aldehyde dehydrogenase family protein [Paraferrimonas sedimenticola]|uniref:Phenylacetaldehyde dehydrogenase n=1 Tax=Paraferrimonas sedimenticola TaxID=375674 RepID=A0AA37RVZ7_9GAMM|nr:aldehyde dehydrogenase family protein [Paraferrimonas sedimenticola]GLP96375.1 phenylacetaldehyde dehydrogenase [Paraferrimonas sedimenticola]
MIQAQLLIDGQWQDAVSGATFEVLSPATEEVFAKVARADKADVDKAVAAAREGFKTWSSLAPKLREQALLKAAEIIEAEGEARLLDILIDESGSTITKAKFEIAYTVDLFRTAAGEARRLYGKTFPNDNPKRLSFVQRIPLGVVAVVSPYNAPLSLLTKMLAFPLAAGNSVVVKPSEETPVIALELGRILLEAGVPAAAVNMVCGFGQDCGASLTSHSDIDCIALTGSTETGKRVGQVAMERMLKTQLELGGKSAALVLQDVDPAKAAAIVAQGIFTHAGQICMANSRVAVDRAIYPEFIAELKKVCESLKVGPTRDADTVYGPLINRAALQKVAGHVDKALSEGAELLTGGRVVEGLVYAPTVLLNTPATSGAWCEELFGPVVSVVPFDTLEQAIEMANDSEFGLSSSVLTKNLNWAMQCAQNIDAGAVHVGMHSFQSNALAPIGGSKMSGIGRSGGAYSTEEFTDSKWISIELEETL